MDIKKAWENKTVRISVIGAALMVLIVVISQSIFTTPVKKEKKTQKKDMQTGFLIDDSQMNKLSNEESQKTYNEMVRQNRIDQNAAKADRDKAEKAQQENKAQIASLASQVQQLTTQLIEMQTSRNGNRNLDAGGPRKNVNEQAPAKPYQLNPNAAVNGVSSGYAPISPTRNSPMRTITQSSIKTNGTDGVIQVMPISENRIREGREVVAGSEKAPTRTIRGDGTAPVDSKA
ncbi:TPA: conjugal transfer protein TraB, partial [Escherichia coli]|nr:conjugal transfer protein TraB [Escherichia coli]